MSNRHFYSLAGLLLALGAIAMVVRWMPGSPAPQPVEKVKLTEGATEPMASTSTTPVGAPFWARFERPSGERPARPLPVSILCDAIE